MLDACSCCYNLLPPAADMVQRMRDGLQSIDRGRYFMVSQALASGPRVVVSLYAGAAGAAQCASSAAARAAHSERA